MGQHFLSNKDAVRRLIDLFSPVAGERVVEIGPGRGALTDPLVEAGVRLVAVERDADLASRLQARYAGRPSVTIVRADALECDLAGLAGEPARLVANLPYSITGEALHRMLLAGPPLTSLLLMLQREVVNRIVAPPGSRVYGSLSVMAQYFTRPQTVMSLSPGSFTPPPAVSSAVVFLPFRALPREVPPEQERAYTAFIRELFAHRRRTLLNNLKAARPEMAGRLAELLSGAGIDPARRPETLAREECLRLRAMLDPPGSDGRPG